MVFCIEKNVTIYNNFCKKKINQSQFHTTFAVPLCVKYSPFLFSHMRGETLMQQLPWKTGVSKGKSFRCFSHGYFKIVVKNGLNKI